VLFRNVENMSGSTPVAHPSSEPFHVVDRVRYVTILHVNRSVEFLYDGVGGVN
jgi:hypothetical protein